MKEGVDYYIDTNGFYVFTAKYLLERGHCCRNACRHCPYGFNNKKNAQIQNNNQENNKSDFNNISNTHSK